MLVAVSFTICTSVAESDMVSADLVVYGKIFTPEGNNIAEAFAVKDGKYIYVGDKKGTEAFIEKGKTEVSGLHRQGPHHVRLRQRPCSLFDGGMALNPPELWLICKIVLKSLWDSYRSSVGTGRNLCTFIP